MELRQLKYFVRIVEAGSVSRASQSLHIAQPALSLQVARLEEELGARLLLRSVRGVTPTVAGLSVYRHALGILKQVEATRLVVEDDGPAGRVSVGLPWTISALFGFALLRDVREVYPSVRLEIVEGPSASLRDALASGKLDLAVVFDEGAEAGLLLTPMAAEALYLVGSAGSLAGRRTVDAADAAERPLLLLSRPNSVREIVEAAWAAAGVTPNVRAEINAPGVLFEALRAGFGFSVLPASGIEEALRSGSVDAALLDEGRLQRTVYLGLSRLHPVSTATQAVAERLRGLARAAMERRSWRAHPLDQAATRP